MRPFLSILCMMVTLLILVFFQMRERHMSYAINRLHQKYKKKEETLNVYLIKLYKLKDPQRLKEQAKKMGLRPLKREQVIPNLPNLGED